MRKQLADNLGNDTQRAMFNQVSAHTLGAAHEFAQRYATALEHGEICGHVHEIALRTPTPRPSPRHLTGGTPDTLPNISALD